TCFSKVTMLLQRYHAVRRWILPYEHKVAEPFGMIGVRAAIPRGALVPSPAPHGGPDGGVLAGSLRATQRVPRLPPLSAAIAAVGRLTIGRSLPSCPTGAPPAWRTTCAQMQALLLMN